MENRTNISSHCFNDIARRVPGAADHLLPLISRRDDLILEHNLMVSTNHHEDFYSLYFVRQGSGRHMVNDVVYSVSRGDVYIMSPGAVHAYRQAEQLVLDALYFTLDIFTPLEMDWLRATAGFLPLLVGSESRGSDDASGGRLLHLNPAQHTRMTQLVDTLHGEWLRGDYGNALMTRALFLELLVRLARFCDENAAADYGSSVAHTPKSEETLAAALRFMDERFAEPLRIEQIAASVFLSADRFTEVFSAAMGRSPSDYLRYIRIEHAKLLLATTDLPITRIAADSGFDQASYFTHVFRKAVDQTPREYRAGARR
ncbi:HTH-type transcriptional activator RhaR [Capsulimonas corticalis]|uniref:HTH-type transcriptional activator RhaR n=1 Tax=Capsulimonas corticalis TaxID=2219043 RepID=A0A402CUP3_9BACT|nr:AraC family transcriptional regulator [Capsulimonas corticalis]BDI29058.1 HTH-type transcriptional activator RhaR [Capsulimonas corticalis]